MYIVSVNVPPDISYVHHNLAPLAANNQGMGICSLFPRIYLVNEGPNLSNAPWWHLISNGLPVLAN